MDTYQGLSFGNFPLFPHVGCPNDDIRLCEFPKDDRGVERVNGSVEASPGYFSISLNNSIKVDMTAALHTAIYRFDFQEFFDSELGNKTDDALSYSPVILIDLSDLSGSRETGQIKFDRTSGRITGSGTFSPSFGKGNYELYFCADFSGAELRDGGVWTNDGPTSSEDTLSVDSSDQSGGAWVRFEGPPEEQSMILARVGVSFISTQQACRSSENEIRLFDFDGTRSAARHAWEKQLSPVTVDSTDASESLKRTFWSSLYRTFISPQDYTGRFLGKLVPYTGDPDKI